MTPRRPRWLDAPLCLVAAAAIAVPAPSDAQSAPLTVLPLYDGGSTEELIQIDLTDGAGWRIDRLRRDPDQVRARRIEENLFEAIGRPTDSPARPGEIHLLPIRSGSGVRAVLFVEASTGYMAYFEELGRGSELGRPLTTLGRPFEDLRAADGKFVFFGRRDGGGRTQGAYLYQTSTGRCLYVEGLAKLELEPRVTPIEGLPRLIGHAAAVPLEISDGETVGYLAIDGAGDVYRFGLRDPQNPRSITVGRFELDLISVLQSGETRESESPRFVPVPILLGEVTRSVLVIDAASGKVALIDEPRGEERLPSIRALPLDLGPLIGDGADQLVAVADVSGGSNTRGAWLSIASSPRRMLYVAGLEDPATARVTQVRIERP